MDIHSKRLDAVQQARRKKAEEAQKAAEEERRLCQDASRPVKRPATASWIMPSPNGAATSTWSKH